MKILVAMDSFKGSLSSQSAAEAVKEGILTVDLHGEVLIYPMADGGEGTMESLLSADDSSKTVSLCATGPLGEQRLCRYGVLGNGTVVIESSEAAGLTLIPESHRDPIVTTTYGIGEMIRHAINRGHREFVIGLGGSGTNDGGVGMLEALGWRFLKASGETIARGAMGLKDLAQIDMSNAMEELKDCKFRIACDVTNPLLGEKGCSAIFGPQKGATAETVKQMDSWLASYCHIVREHFPAADPDLPGSGAAGGLGFAFSTFLNGTMESGADIVAKTCGLIGDICGCDLIITGEGSLDGQSAMGKGPMHIAQLGKQYGIPVIVLAGSIGKGVETCLAEGVSAYFPIIPHPMSLQEAMDSRVAYSNLKNTTIQVMRVFHLK